MYKEFIVLKLSQLAPHSRQSSLWWRHTPISPREINSDFYCPRLVYIALLNPKLDVSFVLNLIFLSLLPYLNREVAFIGLSRIFRFHFNRLSKVLHSPVYCFSVYYANTRTFVDQFRCFFTCWKRCTSVNCCNKTWLSGLIKMQIKFYCNLELISWRW